jgi:hypothetical protein
MARTSSRPFSELPSGRDRTDASVMSAPDYKRDQLREALRLIRGTNRQMTVASKPRLVQRNRAVWPQHNGAQREGQL